eukprot:TRINITY_DN67080_c0_g1_i1.p1 TRINITY_DN67080_c0_g1~~TRINITY_DN67080_c0_g1_i1.p1  ORF type:complete len:522 (+),score=112.04 TRINITY_DN67080_c0_g1_i1:113-1678(+)
MKRHGFVASSCQSDGGLCWRCGEACEAIAFGGGLGSYSRRRRRHPAWRAAVWSRGLPQPLRVLGEDARLPYAPGADKHVDHTLLGGEAVAAGAVSSRWWRERVSERRLEGLAFSLHSEWSSAGRPQPEEQDELVVGLEILRASAEALQRFAETAFAMSLKLLVAQESVLRLAAVASAEISAALALLKPTGGVASSKRSATWVPLLGTPTSIVLQHAGSALDVLKTVTAIHRHTLYPEKVFEFLYDLARHVATTKCRLQAHLSAYLQVAMAEASERCLIARGAVAFGDMSSSAAAAGFRETFGGLLDDGGACPSGLDTTPTSGADAEEAAAPAAPDYIFYPACCRRFHVLSSLLSERLGADEATVRIVEVGVRLAHTTEELLQRFPRLELVAVDPYLGADGDKIHEWVSGRLQQYSDRARLLRLRSEEAAKNLSEEAREKPFDLVFVDGDHSFDHVVQDIELWTPMIRGGGILAGHDVFLPAFDVHAALRYLRRPRVPVVEDVLEKNHSIHIGADHTFFWHV